MAHQYTYPEMIFLEELGFVPEISRAGKFGRFREEYRRGEILGSRGYLSVYLYPNYGDGVAVPTAPVWLAPDSLPRADSVDLNICGFPAGLPYEEYDGLTVDRAVEIVKQYVGRHKAEIEQLGKK